MDVMTPEQRLKAMRSNRGRTGPERALASLLWRAGLRFVTADGYRKMQGVRFLGQPDLIFRQRKIVVFVDGCFWHGCAKCHDFKKDCDRFWRSKIRANILRDRRISRTLRKQGWRVLRVWEHDLRKKGSLAATAMKLAKVLAREEKA